MYFTLPVFEVSKCDTRDRLIEIIGRRGGGAKFLRQLQEKIKAVAEDIVDNRGD